MKAAKIVGTGIVLAAALCSDFSFVSKNLPNTLTDS